MPAINLNNSDTIFTAHSYASGVITIAEENGRRTGLMIFNNSDQAIYVLVDDDATANNFSFKVAAGGFYEMPKGYYTDKVTMLWAASATGKVNVTEILTKNNNRD